MRDIKLWLLALAWSAACTADPEPTAPPADGGGVGIATDLAAVLTPACGDVIVTDLRLETDLTCPGGGLTVTGSDLKINLNGHRITGSGVGAGVSVSGSRGISVFGGTIRGFSMGIFVASSSGLEIKDNDLSANATAVILQASSDNALRANVVRQSLLRAFMLRPNLAGVPSTNNVIVDNLLVDNPTGIYLIRQPGNTIKGNAIAGSTVAAIDLAPGGASDNVIKGNLLMTSSAGIRFGDGWTGNTVLGNTIQANLCGIQGPTSGNILQGNLLNGNAADYCP